MKKVQTEAINPVNRTGKMIRKYREENQITQAELAKGIGYKYGNFVGMLEAGNSVFPLAKGKWLDYAKAIGADPTEFLIAALCDVHPEMEPYLTPLLDSAKKRKKK
jgi:transcriptional regulator with XRE-family HTH domain